MRRAFAALSAALLLGACGAFSDGRREVVSARAPAPIGPYSQAVQIGDTLWLSGQIGLDRQSGALVAGGIQAETRQALRNLDAVLDAGGFRLSDVVQATVYLADLAEFPAYNEVWPEFFRSSPPARSTVGVAALPRGARVEIALVAVRAR